jgi:flagellar hook-basal body complex protein FliE
MLTAAIASTPQAAALAPAQPSSGRPAPPFADLLKASVTGVDQLEDQAAAAVTGILEGSGADLHAAMIATEKADMAFELTLAVRNKAVAAYQQLMGMQF